VRASRNGAGAPAPPPPAAREPAPLRRAAPPRAPEVEVPVDPERLVLVAHPEPESGKALADALASYGLRAIVVHDGVEAILNIQRALPRVVVLDAALPKMFGFQVCELMKRNDSLRRIGVVLIGAIHDQDRYRRPPGELYGADAYLERHQLPDGLLPVLERFGMPLEQRAALPRAQRPAAEAHPRPEPAPPAAAPPPPARRQPAADPALAAEIEQADRLARIIVSDIVLYNAEKFEAGLRAGDVVTALHAELEEGRSLFAQRVDPRVGSPDQFLQRELLRVARSRGVAS
jgi:CheY-like chemotaxis protein